MNNETTQTATTATADISLFEGVTRAVALPAVICAAGVMLFWALPASAQSIKCAEATKPAEFAICNSEELMILDEQLGEMYEKSFVNASSTPERQSVSRKHNEWISKRNACRADVPCLSLRYQERMKELGSRGA